MRRCYPISLHLSDCHSYGSIVGWLICVFIILVASIRVANWQSCSSIMYLMFENCYVISILPLFTATVGVGRGWVRPRLRAIPWWFQRYVISISERDSSTCGSFVVQCQAYCRVEPAGRAARLTSHLLGFQFKLWANIHMLTVNLISEVTSGYRWLWCV